jgi:glutamine synthetase
MSLIATDITGNTVEETGLGYDIGDEDRVCRPVPGSLRPIPWQERPMAQLLLTMEDGHGQPFEANPREVLRRVVARYAERGLTPVVAVELEFYLLDPELDAKGHPRTSVNPSTGERNSTTQVYYMQDLNDYQDFTDAVTEACNAQGIPADTAVAEYAPGQFEINLRHRRDAVQACDDALGLRRAIKEIAARQGLLASFMAKPFADQAGSGTHVHVSVLDGNGNNVFACTPGAPADALRHGIGGLQRTAKDCMLMVAPHANSYRRVVLNAFVPLNDCWGFNNRTVAMRVPHSDPANVRIEHRIAGADANPYLVTAAVLAGILHGLDTQADPGPPIVGNAYEQLPARELNWRDTIADFMASDFVATTFGAPFRHIFGQQKLKELRSFEREVTTLEIDWYLRQV